MKNYTKVLMPVIIAMFAGSLTVVFSQTRMDRQGPPPQMGRMGGGMPRQAMEQLNLTDAQKQQIKTLEENARSSSKEYFDRLKSFDDQLRSMVDAGTFNESQAREILNGKAAVTTELDLIHLRTDIAIRNVLTAEQKAQLEQLKQQRPKLPPPPPPASQN